jgi:hypothetical protein
LIEEGLFPANSDLTFEVMKEALLDNPCMLGPAKSVTVDQKKEKELISLSLAERGKR